MYKRQPEDWVGGDVELQLLDVSKDTLSASESDEDEGDDPENNEREDVYKRQA